MVKAILINSTHNSNSFNNQYTYKFVGGGLELPSDKVNQIAVSQVTIPYSFFNVNQSLYNNASFSIIHNSVTYNISIPNSFMSVDTINKYLQSQMVANGLYTLDIDGQYVYYITLRYNVELYSVDCIFSKCTLSVGGSNPASMTMNNLTMQLVIFNDFGKFLGLSSGTYPSVPSSVNTTVQSNIQVEGSQVQAISLTANIVRNDISTSSGSFYAFTPINTSFGSNISITAPELIWVDCYTGRYTELIIEIRDQLNRPIQLQDNAVCMMLCLKSE